MITLHAHIERRGKGAERLSEDEVDQRYGRMPASLAAALLPFQREGVRYAIARRGRCLIADEMGVGKTLQAIAFASCYQVTMHWQLSAVCRRACNFYTRRQRVGQGVISSRSPAPSCMGSHQPSHDTAAHFANS